MCKHCDEQDLLDVEWLDEEEEADCEWIAEDDEGEDDEEDDELDREAVLCDEPATLLVTMRMVDAHLCPKHHASLVQQFEEGLGDMLAAAGLQDDVEFLDIPADDDETCSECSNRATKAQVVTYHQYYCTDHAKEAGATLPPGP